MLDRSQRFHEKFFEDRGVDPKKLVTLKIFDYLIPNGEINHAKFERSVSVAGNLDVSKTQYLKDIGKIDAKFNLYGLNFTLDAYKNVEYHGAFPADEIANQLNSGFGLIWDGSSIETCDGAFGNYLRYNNPHKLSLYLASALPVIIWSQAAEASFIIDNNLGLTIDSLNDLPKVLNKVTKEEYEHFAINAREVAKKLRRGDFTKVALKKAVKALEK
ncbi:galactofuranosyltransferase [Lactobacillus delbrueckii]|nr:galactofuranosyltransferase [Lactobacillus delbrueckii]